MAFFKNLQLYSVFIVLNVPRFNLKFFNNFFWLPNLMIKIFSIFFRRIIYIKWPDTLLFVFIFENKFYMCVSKVIRSESRRELSGSLAHRYLTSLPVILVTLYLSQVAGNIHTLILTIILYLDKVVKITPGKLEKLQQGMSKIASVK